MSDEANIAIITAFATIGGGLVGQALTIFYQGKMNNLERIRLVQARAAQLYDREIRAYDAIVPAMSALLYICREMSKMSILREHRKNDDDSIATYRELQDRMREAVNGHLRACAENFHVIGPVAVQTIDAAASELYGYMNELSAPVMGGTPTTEERVKQILDGLEAMRQRMLKHFWNSLDTQTLETSFQEVHEPLADRPMRMPELLQRVINREEKEPLESSHVES